MLKVLIPDYLGQHTLSGIRSLTKNGDQVDLASDTHFLQRVIFRSRAINRYLHLPKAYDSPQAYISGIHEILSEREYDILIPFGLGSYYSLAKHRDEVLSKITAILPDFESFEMMNDKLRANTFCQKLGIEVPEFFSDYKEDDINEIANSVKFPVVIKARSGSGVKDGVRFARNADELRFAYEEITSKISHGPYNPENPLIQEFIPGYVHDACTLSHQGIPLNVLTQIRQIMYPVTGGVGAVNITTDNSKLRKIAQKILEAVHWNGPAQIEFKLDPRDGKYKFIEFNPKLWGTLDLSIKAGMNFPVMIRDLCVGKKVTRMQSYQKGIRYIFRYKQYYQAKRELARISDWNQIIKKHSYQKSYSDICIKDPLPDLFRLIYTIVMRSNVGPLNDELTLDYVLNGTPN